MARWPRGGTGRRSRLKIDRACPSRFDSERGHHRRQHSASRRIQTLNTLKRSDFDYELPPQLIAQQPLPQRSASRLLVLDGGSARLEHRQMVDLPLLLRAGDLLVFNDTRVLPARLAAHKQTGGKIELFLERPLPRRRALVQLRDSKSVRPGATLRCAGGSVQVIGRQEPFWEVELPQDAVAFFESYGSVPLPPYIARAAEAYDRERYQSLLARVPGAVAAPTASLHFDQPLFDALTARGVERTTITLHVGAGTFQPVRTEQIDEHRMHSERYEVTPAAVAAIGAARARSGRVIAVGTTVARALESASLQTSGQLAATCADTALFITPGFRFRVIDALLTNFHLPQSTLLMLVAALAGRETVLAAYRQAVLEHYRFFSYGDAMLVWPLRLRGGA